MRPFLLLTTLLLGLALGCEGPPETGGSGQAPRAKPALVAPASDPIASATAYLASACDAEGRFAYRLHVSVPGDQSAGDYNVLRHAGAIYALDQAWRARHDPNAEAAIRRATRYLVTHHLRPLPGAPKTRVIASRIGEETTRPVAKLGGAGLGLVALSAAHRLDSSLVSLDELRGLARFVLFCQREDGSFRSKRYLDACGWSSFVSLYYPGEAILGLLRLYALDPDPAWLVAAARAAAFLVLSRVDIPASKLPHDHWLLIAGSELLPLWSELRSSPVPAAAVRRHLDRLATLFLDVQAEIRAVGRYPGSFHHSGSVCPSATRLEGLVAYSSLPATSPGAPLRPRLLAGIKLGARFLKASQLQLPARPDLCGAFPRGLLEGDDDAAGKRGEVRVDFTQHSLSALLGAAGLETTRR